MLSKDDIDYMRRTADEYDSLLERWKHASAGSQEVANLHATFKARGGEVGRMVENGLFRRILASIGDTPAPQSTEGAAVRDGLPETAHNSVNPAAGVAPSAAVHVCERNDAACLEVPIPRRCPGCPAGMTAHSGFCGIYGPSRKCTCGVAVDARGVIVGIADQPLPDAARVLAEFAKTAPGRLPQRVQDAIAVVTAGVKVSSEAQPTGEPK